MSLPFSCQQEMFKKVFCFWWHCCERWRWRWRQRHWCTIHFGSNLFAFIIPLDKFKWVDNKKIDFSVNEYAVVGSMARECWVIGRRYVNVIAWNCAFFIFSIRFSFIFPAERTNRPFDIILIVFILAFIASGHLVSMWCAQHSPKECKIAMPANMRAKKKCEKFTRWRNEIFAPREWRIQTCKHHHHYTFLQRFRFFAFLFTFLSGGKCRVLQSLRCTTYSGCFPHTKPNYGFFARYIFNGYVLGFCLRRRRLGDPFCCHSHIFSLLLLSAQWRRALVSGRIDRKI